MKECKKIVKRLNIKIRFYTDAHCIFSAIFLFKKILLETRGATLCVMYCGIALKYIETDILSLHVKLSFKCNKQINI